jgi:hypothetical protein
MKYCQQYKKPFRNNLSYECFTRAKINGISYKAQPNWHGREWYDWAVVINFQRQRHQNKDEFRVEIRFSALDES